MKKKFFGFIILFALAGAGSAFTAEYKAPPVAAPAFNWSGFYAGGNLGAGFNNLKYELDPSGCFLSAGIGNCGVGGVAGNPSRTFSSTLHRPNFTAGGQFGYNWRLMPSIIAGIETDLNYSSADQTNTVTSMVGMGSTTHTLTQRLDWFGTFRGRLGFLAAPDWLIYATGGLAYGNVSSTTSLSPVQCCSGEAYGGSASSTRLFGWTVGGGVEKFVAPNWSLKAEYLYVDLGSLNYADPCTTARVLDSEVCGGFAPPTSYTSILVTRAHIIRAGLNYHFDTSGSSARLNTPAVSAATSRFYASAEYLSWWAKGAPLSVPLVSTGPISTTHHGWLINSDATVLYGAPFAPAVGGNDTQGFPSFSGTRLTLGYWLDDAKRFAVEGGGFLLERRTAGFEANSGKDGLPIINIPVYNMIPYSPPGRTGGLPPAEDGLPASLPDNEDRFDTNSGIFSGGVKITNSLQFWGAYARGVVPLYRTSSWELSALPGFRYLNLSESFDLLYQSTGVTGSYAGQYGAAWDQFRTRNQFYGATLGLRGRYSWGPVSVELTGTVDVGVSHEVLDVSGGYYVYNYIGSFRSGPEGVFAQPANEGRFTSNRFAAVPELQAKFGYGLTPSIRITAGYDFLYYSNVVRPGDNINRNIPKGQTFQQGGNTVSTTSPAPLFKTTDFYAQGLSVGLTVQF